MKKKLIVVIVVLCTTSVFADQPMGATNTDNFSLDTRLHRLENMSRHEQEALLRDAINSLRQIQDALLITLKSTNNDVKCFAAYLLGEYRSSKATTELARAVAMEDRVRQNSREWFWGIHPAVEALVKIGNPSIPAVLRNLEESDDSKVQELSLKVIYYIENDKEITQIRLRRAIETQSDPAKKARLQAALRASVDLK